MKALARLERFIQDLVERPAWLLTERRLHPIEIAAVLTRALETDALPLADRVLAPDGYALRLHPDDFAQLGTVRRTLEREYAEYLSRVVKERGLSVNAPILVVIVESEGARPGSIEVTTRFSESQPGRTIARVRDPALTTQVPVPRLGPTMAQAPAVLEVLNDEGTVVSRLSLNGDALVIGRRTSSGLALADAEVSRRHAQIDQDTAGFSLHDLDSMNGTVVNGRRITRRHVLRDGDLIEVGHTRLRFVQGG
ncbi:MAG: FhaA domain-containing protein [Dehalococcoidia bacterium]